MTMNNVNGAQIDDGEDTGRSRTFLASAVIVGAIVALGLALALSNIFGGDSDPTPAGSAPTLTPSSSSSTSTSSQAASVCGLTAVEETGTVNLAPTAEWALIGTTAAPSIKGQGPGKVETDGYRSCYARTPTGALLAAANYAAIGSHDPLRKKFYDQTPVPGPGRDALRAKPLPVSGSDGTRVQIAGFRVLRYDGRTAEIDLAFRTSNGAVGGTVLHLQWSEGDWKLQLAEDGSELSSTVQLPSLAGYVLWSGV